VVIRLVQFGNEKLSGHKAIRSQAYVFGLKHDFPDGVKGITGDRVTIEVMKALPGRGSHFFDHDAQGSSTKRLIALLL